MRMTDTEVQRTNRFIDEIGDAITQAIARVDPASPWASEARRGLARISGTLHAVPFVTMCNLANVDAALRKRFGVGLMPLIAARLTSVGAGPSLDFQDAADFFRVLEPMIDVALEAQGQLIEGRSPE